MRPILCALCAGVIAVSFTPGSGAQDKKPIRAVLVIGGGHDYNGFAKMLAGTFAQVDGITLVETLGPGKEKGQPHIDKLADLKRDQADVVIFYTVGYKLGEAQERALEKFVDDGGGVAAIHCASASFGSSQTWFRLIGARFAGHYKGLHKLEIKVDDEHPVTRGVGPFTVDDEEYNHGFAKVDRKVIAEFKQRPEGSKAKDNDAVWVREVGKGRVFYSALGHGKEAWANPAWQRLVLQGICWAAGQPRQIQLPAGKEPR